MIVHNPNARGFINFVRIAMTLVVLNVRMDGALIATPRKECSANHVGDLIHDVGIAMLMPVRHA